MSTFLLVSICNYPTRGKTLDEDQTLHCNIPLVFTTNLQSKGHNFPKFEKLLFYLFPQSQNSLFKFYLNYKKFFKVQNFYYTLFLIGFIEKISIFSSSII